MHTFVKNGFCNFGEGIFVCFRFVCFSILLHGTTSLEGSAPINIQLRAIRKPREPLALDKHLSNYWTNCHTAVNIVHELGSVTHVHNHKIRSLNLFDFFFVFWDFFVFHIW